MVNVKLITLKVKLYLKLQCDYSDAYIGLCKVYVIIMMHTLED